MPRINLKWIGPYGDSSGYASASRSYIKALIKAPEINLSLESKSFENIKTSHESFLNLIQPFVNKAIMPSVQIVHLTPENYAGLVNKQIYSIGYTTWETDKLPSGWAEACNLMDEIWVPSNWNKKVFKSSGVTKPITVIPHCVDSSENINISKLELDEDITDDIYCFYSIFQWHERKCPVGLLKAYLTEFKPDEKVCLLIKSYRMNTSPSEQIIIKQDIANIKQALHLENYPKMRFFGTLLNPDQMFGLHTRGDCFVLPTRAEGFGIPYAEAMALGKPTIGTNYSGHLDFMNNSNSFLIPCQETPVYNMIFPHYTGDMTWCDPDITKLKSLMRYCFENRQEAINRGIQAKKDMQEKYNSKTIANLIVTRLREIKKGL